MAEAFIPRRVMGGATLQSIAITTPPNRTAYVAGESFDSTGMVVTATIGKTDVVVTGYTVSPSTITAGTTSVIISYTFAGVTKTATQAVSAITVSTTLNDNSWETIRAVSDIGAGANYWSVGDCKAVTLNGTGGTVVFSNTTLYVFILGFNHNSALEGENRIHFQGFKTALTGGTDVGLCDSSYSNTSSTTFKYTMNTSSTNSGGWASCQMRTNMMGANGTPTSPTENSIMSVLPSDLRAVMKSVTKYTDNTGGSSNLAASVTATTDYLFLLAEFEVFGVRTYANTTEQTKQAQYDYYANGNSKVKYKHNATTTTARWWERSPYTGNSSHFCYVYTDGSSGVRNAYNSYAVAPAFAV